MQRRSLLALGLAALVPSASAAPALAAIPPSGRLAFRAFRNDSPLGSHVVTFANRGPDLIVTSAIDYLVKLGPITLFRYTLRSNETWRDNTLMAVRSETNDDGKTDFMRADRTGDSLAIDGSKTGRYTAPPGAIAASHWNPREVDAPMISPQSGELLTFTINGRRPETAPGLNVPAQRISLTGPNELDLWYEPSGTWASLRAVARDGSIITYVRD